MQFSGFHQGRNWAMTNSAENEDSLVLTSEEAKVAFERALTDRHEGRYIEAIDAIEHLIQTEGDSAALWRELAIGYFMWWQAYAKSSHTLEAISTTARVALALKQRSSNCKVLPNASIISICLQHTYNTYLIAMEYSSNKQNPSLLLQLTRLYMEFGSFRGALSVCTLLIEGYSSTFERLNEAIFLAAVTAHALGKHHESAQYLQYIVDKPPRGVHAFQLYLLSGVELAKVKHESALGSEMEKDAYTQAYRAVILLSPATISEKAVHEEYKNSRKSEAQRIERWRRDPRTWIDLAKRMAGVDVPVFVAVAIELARIHLSSGIALGIELKPGQSLMPNLPLDVLMLEAAVLNRLGHRDDAIARVEEILYSQESENYYSSKPCRFLLGQWNEAWCARFELEVGSINRILSWLRRCRLRILWMNAAAHLVSRHRNEQATVIQCAWKCYCARIQLERHREERHRREITENETMWRQDVLLIMKELNAAARTIQGLLSILYAKKERDMRRRLRERHNSLVTTFGDRRRELQQSHVFFKWREFITLLQQERTIAACAIQRWMRVFLTRRMYLRLLGRKRRQDQLVLSFLDSKKVSLRRRLVVAWHGYTVQARADREKAAVIIQRRYRVRLTRNKFLSDLYRHQTAVKIMREFVFSREQRMLQTSWKALENHAIYRRLEKRSGAIRIQSRARGMLARAHVRKLRLRRRKIERAIANMKAKSRAQILRSIMNSLQQNVEMNWEERESCTITIQRAFRGFRARKRVALIRECEKLLSQSGGTVSLLKGREPQFVLRLCFLVLVRLPRSNMSKRQHSQLTLQRWWRARLQRKQLQENIRKRIGRRKLLLRYQLDALRIAKLFFAQLHLLLDAKTWRRNLAATRIQRLIRSWLARNRYARVIEHHNAACDRAKQWAIQQRTRKLAAIMGQWKTMALQHREERQDAVRRIQRIFRARRAKREADKIVAKKVAQARMLEAAAHQSPLERCFHKWEELVLEKAALSIRSAASRAQSPLGRMLGLNDHNAKPLGRLPSKPTTESALNSPGRNRRCLGNNKLEEELENRTLAQRVADVPPILFYTLLNRVRQSGILQLAFSGGIGLRDIHLRQLVALASCIISDAGVADPLALSPSFLPNLNEQLIDAVAGVAECPVQKLMLHNSRLDVAHLAALGSALRQPSSRLVALVLVNVPLGTSAAVALAAALLGCSPRLEQLVLERCGLGSAGATAVLEAARHCRALWKLDLSANRVADAACPALAAALLACASLRLVSLAHCRLSDSGALRWLLPALEALARAGGARLELLELRGNERLSRRVASALDGFTQRTSAL